MTTLFPTSNSFLDRANENLTQLSISCSPTTTTTTDNNNDSTSHFSSVSNIRQQQQPGSASGPSGASNVPPGLMSSPADDHNLLPSYQTQFPPLNVVNGNGNGPYDNNNPSHLNLNNHNQQHTNANMMSYGHIATNGDATNTATSSPFGSSVYLNGNGDPPEVHLPTSLLETTQILSIPVEERCFVDGNDFGAREQKSICKKAQEEFKVKVELTPHRDRSLSIMIAGRNDQVLKARKYLLSYLQKQASDKVKIPREYHGAIIGKGALKLKELETLTATKISFPPQNSQDENISIVGTREGIAHAKHRLEIMTAEQAKNATEKIPIPKVYHAFICGPYNRQIEQWQGEQGCKVNVPPVSVDSDEIVLSGNRDGVGWVRNEIIRLVNDISKNMGKLDVQIDKAKHKYIIGQRGKGIQEILEKYTVSVEVPHLDSSSNNITLRGQSQNLGAAVSEVYDRAESYKIEKIRCPNWLHRYLIGRDGSKLQELLGDNVSKVHVEFSNDEIIIDGQRDSMEMICSKLQNEVEMLELQKTYEEITVDNRFHKHVIGKNGANIRQLCNGKQVQIKVPNGMDDSNIIRVEGNKEDMQSVMMELRKLIHRVENEKSEDVKIEHRLHRMLIGQNGENIRRLREAYPEVVINFPEVKANSGTIVGKSELVNVRGPKDQVDKCIQQLKKSAKELAENNHELYVNVCRKYHKNIIGREGVTINQIRKETNTKIEMPPAPLGVNGDPTGSDVIKIIGRKENTEKAKKKILEIESQQANIIEHTLDIPFKQHKTLIGKAGDHIKSIVNECGGDVTVHFPQDGGNKVNIRGDRKDVEKVVKRLNEEANKICEATEDIKVDQELHRFLIGRQGSYVKKLQEESGGCTIFFESNSDVITLAGSKEAIAKARDLITKRVQKLKSTVESEVDIDPKLHRYFMQNGRRVLLQVMDECGGVQISFPPLQAPSQSQQNNNAELPPVSSIVRVKGPVEYVNQAKERLLQIVDDLKNQSWCYVDIAAMHHRTILGSKGSNVQQIESDLNVRIKFPDQGRNQGDSPSHNAQMSAMMMAGVSRPPPQQPNQILVLGRKENLENTSERLLALVPVEDYVHVPQRFHSSLIGSGGGQLRDMQTKHNVKISIPRPGGNPNSDEWKGPDDVVVFGTPENVRSAKADLESVVNELIAKTYRIELVVNPKFFYKIIGPKGSTITKLKERFGVEIMMPRQNAAEDEPIIVMGYQEKADKCKDEIAKLVSELESYETVEIEIDPRLHARFIGAKGKSLKKIQDQYKVEIKFPGRNSPAANRVTITGKSEPVDECRDKLLCMAEEYALDLEDDIEKDYMHPSSQHRHNGSSVAGSNRESSGYVVRDAPWDPENANATDFPALDMQHLGAAQSVWPVRGSRR